MPNLSESPPQTIRNSRALTDQQRRVYDYVAAYFAEHGKTPTLTEIAAELGVSKSSAYEHVQLIAKKGWLTIVPNVARGIRLKGRCPTCGHAMEVPAVK